MIAPALCRAPATEPNMAADDFDPMHGLGEGAAAFILRPISLHQPIWSPDGRHLVFIEQDGQDTRL